MLIFCFVELINIYICILIVYIFICQLKKSNNEDESFARGN